MIHRHISTYLFLLSLFLSPFLGQGKIHALEQRVTQNFPQVDRDYIYDQLYTLATQFQHREAGYDNNLPMSVNGHDEFAAYWSREMLRNLQGFGAQVQRDLFEVQGWKVRPATLPAFNVEVTIPGIMLPMQTVVIGCHYDGMANSTQSANDDGSGCAIELGIARAMAEYWRANRTYPARTLRFVLFDAEEQGIFGSAHYVNVTANRDLTNIVAMFNEEQNGIAYPLRYLGQMVNPLLPLYVLLSPQQDNSEYQMQNSLSWQQRKRIARFHSLMQQAPAAVFAEMRALDIRALTYHDVDHQNVLQPIFTVDQLNNIKVQDDAFGHSDQVPFTLAGVPCATFEGNDTYYNSQPPPWSYPYDQPDDTIQLMNTFADGSSYKSQALALALTIPGMLTTWMLTQPDILGQAAFDGEPIVSFNMIGTTQSGQNITFNASMTFQPGVVASSMHYTWSFGDHSVANGVKVNHTYRVAGTYTLTLTVESGMGQRSLSKAIRVVDQAPSYTIPYRWDQNQGIFNPNPAVVLPEPDNSLSDQIGITTKTNAPAFPASLPTTASLRQRSRTSEAALPAIVIAIVSLLFGSLLFLKKQERARTRDDSS